MKFSLLATIAICIASLLYSCHSNSSGRKVPGKLTAIQRGMSYIEVLEKAGFPDNVVNVGVTTDELGLQTKTEEWHYGDNQLIVMVNDTVSSIDLDLENTYRHIRHIIDSAKAAGDTTQLIQPIR